MRRESCFISPGGWDLLLPRTGAWGGGDPKRLTLRIPGFLGISASHWQPSPLLPFPQGLGSHHSGLRTIKDWEPRGWTSPTCTPVQASFRQEGPRTLGSPGGLQLPRRCWVEPAHKPGACPAFLGHPSRGSRDLAVTEAHLAPGPLSLHPPTCPGRQSPLGVKGNRKVTLRS